VIWVAAQGNTYDDADDGGVYKSEDGGETWRRVLTPENTTTGAVDLALDQQPAHSLRRAVGQPAHGLGPALRRCPAAASGAPATAVRPGSASAAVCRTAWARSASPRHRRAARPRLGHHRGRGRRGRPVPLRRRRRQLEQLNGERILIARSWYYMHIFADPNDANTVYVLNARS
jgi:hypothetical protein